MMLTRRFLTLSLLLAALVALFAPTEAGAVLGDGVCDPQEEAQKQCAKFGTNFVLEIIPQGGFWPVQTTCGFPAVPCSRYPYLFSGPSGDNQVNILIPADIQVLSGCSQVAPPGAGDPTTGFGKSIFTHQNCRIAFNPPTPPPGSNIVIDTTPALIAPTSTQLKSGKTTFGDDILGPGGQIPQISTTSQTITTGDGVTLTVETDQQGNLVNATSSSPNLQIFDLSELLLCVPTAPGQPIGSLAQCLPLVFGTDRCDLKIEGSDPCKVIGGKATCY